MLVAIVPSEIQVLVSIVDENRLELLTQRLESLVASLLRILVTIVLEQLC